MCFFVRRSLALVTSLIVAGTAAAQAQQRRRRPKSRTSIPRQLLREAPGRAEAEAQFEREVGVYRQQIQRMDDSLRTLVAAFERDAPKLDSAARETRAEVDRPARSGVSDARARSRLDDAGAAGAARQADHGACAERDRRDSDRGWLRDDLRCRSRRRASSSRPTRSSTSPNGCWRDSSRRPATAPASWSRSTTRRE